MRGVYIFVAILCGLWGLTNASATEPTNASNKRFLFIVETSSATKAGAANAQKLLTTLIESGMGGLMETGDTYGLWTFNEQLYAGQLPMQRWAIESAREQAQQIGEILKKQKFQKEPQMEPVLRPMYSIIRNSPTITVVLVTSGKKPMQGTPFDRDINEFYKDHFRDFQKQKTPFVTMLLAQEGDVLRHSVSAALGDVKIPKPLPPKPAPVKEQKQESKAPANGPSTNTVASAKPLDKPQSRAPETNVAKALVITKSGAQTVEGEAVAALPKPTEKPAEQPKTSAGATEKAPTAVSTSIPPAPPVEIAALNASTNTSQRAEPVAAVPSRAEEKTVAKPTSSLPPPPAEPVKTSGQTVATPVVAAPISNAVVSIEPKAKPAEAATTNSNPVDVTTPPTKPAVSAAAPAATPTAAQPPTQPVAVPVAVAPATPTPAPVVAVAPVPPVTPAATAPQPVALTPVVEQDKKTSATPVLTDKIADTSTAPSQRSAPNAATAAVKPKVYLIIGFALVLVAVVTAFLMGRHTNRKPERSLISDWANQNSTK